MKRMAILVVAAGSLLFLVVGITWLVREHRKALDAQCIYNLMSIDGAKQQWALEHFPRGDERDNAIATTEDIHLYNSRNQDPMPVCPRGGTYTIARAAEMFIPRARIDRRDKEMDGEVRHKRFVSAAMTPPNKSLQRL